MASIGGNTGQTFGTGGILVSHFMKNDERGE
jgi:hypothetical protein